MEQTLEHSAVLRPYDKNLTRVGYSLALAGLILSITSSLFFSALLVVPLLIIVSGLTIITHKVTDTRPLAEFIAGPLTTLLFSILLSALPRATQIIEVSLTTFTLAIGLLPFIVIEPQRKIARFLYVHGNILLMLSYHFLLYRALEPIVSGWTALSEFAVLFVASAAVLGLTYRMIILQMKEILLHQTLSIRLDSAQRVIKATEAELTAHRADSEQTRKEEQNRRWISEGIAVVSEILRKQQQESELHCELTSTIVKRLKANQASFFIVDEDQMHLQLQACYAYERRKFLQQKIHVKEGLVGQCYQEGEVIILKNVQKDYIKITSGLGAATPRCLVLVPLKSELRVEGVLEIASFSQFNVHQLEFLERVSYIIGTGIRSIHISLQTQRMLENTRRQAEQITQHQEETRRHVEHLMAVQKEMHEKEMQLRAQSDLLELVVDNIPFPVFIKNERGQYTLANRAQASILNYPKEEIIGFDDSKFIEDSQAIRLIRESDHRVIDQQREVHFPEQQLRMPGGEQKILKTSKIPFRNSLTQKINILGVSIDVTDVNKAQQQLSSEIEALKRELESSQRISS
ncbi:GAF domain-containing protein [Chryseolinea lacunae]|uniref:GAF domain-containing protein n=1 Tax=Chryseolinea lacunae TaxID=2801331 RepID=A0ABS1L2L1_9BACT|nr:GAF domain-containing protein [Chryseolinea lacunae]MBL0745772.1 GAF domain-containing protein [Chryseolinea lacunae]